MNINLILICNIYRFGLFFILKFFKSFFYKIFMDNNLEWKIVCLEHDNPSIAIADLFKRLWPEKVDILNIDCEIEISKENLKKQIKSLKIPANKKILFTLGHGCRHHYTYGFTTIIADKLSQRYAYIHFDHHTDYLSHNEHVSCGRFVKSLVKDSNAIEPLLIGCGVNDLTTIKQIRGWHPFQNDELENHLLNLPDDVYISFDLDVLRPEIICTGYSQGYMELSTLKKFIEIIKTKKRIIGADIIGSSFKWDNSGHFVYAGIASSILDLDNTPLTQEFNKYPKIPEFYKSFFN